MKKTELITNKDGSIFHLNLLPEDVADKIIIVGDPGRVEMISSMFDTIRVKKSNREFYTATGSYKECEVTVISSGIGTDNIDIVMNELDALFNIDLKTGVIKEKLSSFDVVRIGTSGALQGDIPAGSVILSSKAVGFDGLIHFYEGYEWILDGFLADALAEHIEWPDTLSFPYVVDADAKLLASLDRYNYRKGITISTPGFYAPQGRSLRLHPFDMEINDRIGSFNMAGKVMTNYEMESSAIYALSKMLGHRALTACVIIGNRVTGEFVNDYKPLVKDLAKNVLDSFLVGA